MKVVAFNGSARAKGNTAVMLNAVLQFPEPHLSDRSDDRRGIRLWEYRHRPASIFRPGGRRIVKIGIKGGN